MNRQKTRRTRVDRKLDRNKQIENWTNKNRLKTTWT